MSHYGFDIENFLFKVHACNQPVLVSADIENNSSGFGGIIGCGKRLFQFREVLPLASTYQGCKSGEGFAGMWVLSSEICITFSP